MYRYQLPQKVIYLEDDSPIIIEDRIEGFKRIGYKVAMVVHKGNCIVRAMLVWRD